MLCVALYSLIFIIHVAEAQRERALCLRLLPLLSSRSPRAFNRPRRKPIRSDGFVTHWGRELITSLNSRRVHVPFSPRIIASTETFGPNYLFDTIRYARLCRIYLIFDLTSHPRRALGRIRKKEKKKKTTVAARKPLKWSPRGNTADPFPALLQSRNMF